MSHTFHGQNDPPDPTLSSATAEHGLLVHDTSGDWNVVLIEHGMQSGAPSVLVWIPTALGVVVLETSLDAWRAATVVLGSAAEARFGYRLHD